MSEEKCVHDNIECRFDGCQVIALRARLTAAQEELARVRVERQRRCYACAEKTCDERAQCLACWQAIELARNRFEARALKAEADLAAAKEKEAGDVERMANATAMIADLKAKLAELSGFDKSAEITVCPKSRLTEALKKALGESCNGCFRFFTYSETHGEDECEVPSARRIVLDVLDKEAK